MIQLFLLGVALLAGLLLAVRWLAEADPKVLARLVKWGLLGAIGAVFLFLLATGRLVWAFAALWALVPWFFRLRQVARTAKAFSRMASNASGAPTGDGSKIETCFLRMTLDHDSGAMDGVVLEGDYKGSRLQDLPIESLIDLLKAYWAADHQSAQVLEAYLDRTHEGWREAAHDTENQENSKSFAETMDQNEALCILGLKPGASPQEIKKAHRRLIAGLHPDHGGSNYLTAKINLAKDVLLGD